MTSKVFTKENSRFFSEREDYSSNRRRKTFGLKQRLYTLLKKKIAVKGFVRHLMFVMSYLAVVTTLTFLNHQQRAALCPYCDLSITKVPEKEMKAALVIPPCKDVKFNLLSIF